MNCGSLDGTVKGSQWASLCPKPSPAWPGCPLDGPGLSWSRGWPLTSMLANPIKSAPQSPLPSCLLDGILGCLSCLVLSLLPCAAATEEELARWHMQQTSALGLTLSSVTSGCVPLDKWLHLSGLQVSSSGKGSC